MEGCPTATRGKLDRGNEFIVAGKRLCIACGFVKKKGNYRKITKDGGRGGPAWPYLGNRHGSEKNDRDMWAVPEPMRKT